MTLQDLAFPQSFFEDEVREGFFISSMMKRNWACQLEILKVIDTICHRHKIPWFMDSGTLLGAVRHQGFIPWDDDIDIAMKRSDQRRFIEAARTELPAGFVLKNPETDPDAGNSNISLYNSDMIDTSTERMERFHGFPYGVCVDILPLDGIPDDDTELEKLHQRIKTIRDALIYCKHQKTEDPAFLRQLKQVEKENEISLLHSKHIEGDLWRLMVRHHTGVSDVGSARLELFWGEHSRNIYPAEYYEASVMLPFEFLELPAPAMYREVLQTMFGDYKLPVRRRGSHLYPVYGGQERKFASEINCHPFRYTMTVENINAERDEKPRAQAIKIFALLDKTCAGLQAAGGDAKLTAKLLLAMQNLILKLTDLFTPIFTPYNKDAKRSSEDEGAQALVYLRTVSESIFTAFQNWHPDMAMVILQQVKLLQEKAFTAYDLRNEILFLPARAEWWQAMEPTYRKLCNEARTVVCLKQPIYEKKISGKKGEQVNTEDVFPEELLFTDSAFYDIEKRHPTKIVVQFPFDTTNTALTTDDAYLTMHLRNCTDELIYVPCYVTDDPRPDDTSLQYMLGILAEQPAVAFADRIIVQSEELRSFYINELTAKTGGASKRMWEDKIQTLFNESQ